MRGIISAKINPDRYFKFLELFVRFGKHSIALVLNFLSPFWSILAVNTGWKKLLLLNLVISLNLTNAKFKEVNKFNERNYKCENQSWQLCQVFATFFQVLPTFDCPCITFSLSKSCQSILAVNTDWKKLLLLNLVISLNLTNVKFKKVNKFNERNYKSKINPDRYFKFLLLFCQILLTFDFACTKLLKYLSSKYGLEETSFIEFSYFTKFNELIRWSISAKLNFGSHVMFWYYFSRLDNVRFVLYWV
jgi:hypothetical protein